MFYIAKQTDSGKKNYQHQYARKNHEYLNSPEYKFKQYNRSAWKRNKRFELTFEQFMELWRKPCAYCREPIEYIGIDRIDNNVGYTPENVISCCSMCNKMKWMFSRDQFLSRCRQIVMTTGT